MSEQTPALGASPSQRAEAEAEARLSLLLGELELLVGPAAAGPWPANADEACKSPPRSSGNSRCSRGVTLLLRGRRAFRQRDLQRQEMLMAVFRSWADIQKARGRPETELILGNCVNELGICRGNHVDFQRLTRVADLELRQATLAAAWKAAKRTERRSRARPGHHTDQGYRDVTK